MRLQNKRVGVFVEEGFEDLEFWVPVMRLREEGAQVTIIGSGRADGFRAKHCLEAQPDVTADQVSADDFDALVVPGGWAPDKLRRVPAVLELVRTVYEQGKIIGSICHAGWVLASAGIVKGHRSHRHQGRPDQRWRRLGGPGCLPRRQHRLGTCGQGHPRLLPRTCKRYQ